MFSFVCPVEDQYCTRTIVLVIIGFPEPVVEGSYLCFLALSEL